MKLSLGNTFHRVKKMQKKDVGDILKESQTFTN